MKSQFERYVGIIRKKAHEYSSKYGVDYSEVESQGFLIYCECLKKYDETKSSFSTYLYIQLNRLNDYVRTYKRQQGVCIEDYFSNENDTEIENDYEKMIPAREISPTMENLLDEGKSVLSKKAYELLEWLVGRTWERKNKRTPTIFMACEHFNFSMETMNILWKECKDFWNNNGVALYA